MFFRKYDGHGTCFLHQNSIYICHRHTHARTRAIQHWHFSSYFHGLLTVTDSVCCLDRPTKMLLEQGSIHNTLTRIHRIYDGHHFFQSLVVPKDAGQVTRHWTPEVSISALSNIQYACSDFVIISHYFHTGLLPCADISWTVTVYYQAGENFEDCSRTVRTHEHEAN